MPGGQQLKGPKPGKKRKGGLGGAGAESLENCVSKTKRGAKTIHNKNFEQT